MKFDRKEPAREFEVGLERKSVMRDCGSLHLAADEQVTFLTDSGREYDVARKSWGFYATPSLNGRLAGFDLRAVLVKSQANRFFVLLVEGGKERDFDAYVNAEGLTVVTWMDTTEALSAIAKGITRGA